jgi:iron-sulfur cluster repair protein YtfE (RIC family)
VSVPTTTASTVQQLPDHVLAFGLLHQAMRRDVRRLLTASRNLTPAAMTATRTWWTRVHEIVDWHHRTEDGIVWPELRRRVTGFSAAEKSLDHHHENLDRALRAVDVALASGDPTTVRPAAEHLDAILTEHLAAEEKIVFPAFSTGMTQSQYLSMERQVLARSTAGVAASLLPWLLDGVDSRTAQRMLRFVPPPVRVAASTVLQWRYQSLVRPVLRLV